MLGQRSTTKLYPKKRKLECSALSYKGALRYALLKSWSGNGLSGRVSGNFISRTSMEEDCS